METESRTFSPTEKHFGLGSDAEAALGVADSDPRGPGCPEPRGPVGRPGPRPGPTACVQVCGTYGVGPNLPALLSSPTPPPPPPPPRPVLPTSGWRLSQPQSCEEGGESRAERLDAPIARVRKYTHSHSHRALHTPAGRLPLFSAQGLTGKAGWGCWEPPELMARLPRL